MGRRTQLIRIPLEQGIRTYADPYTIGAQCRVLQNLTLQTISPIGGRMWRMAPVLDSLNVTSDAVTALGTPTFGTNTNKYLTGIVSAQLAADTTPTLYVGGIYSNSTTGGNHFGVWDLLNDVALHAFGTTTLVNGAVATQPALLAFWPSQQALYGGQALPGSPSAATTLSKITITDYSPLTGAFAPWTTPASAIRPSALIQHLDRLFLSKADDTTIYTDPFDDTTIRATSFITTPGLGPVTAYARPSVGDIDASISAHLIIGGQGSIWVFDGDPQFGNASLRKLVEGIGIPGQTLIVETPYGAIFLGTDGRFHLIPPGAAQLDPAPWSEVADRVADLIPATNYQQVGLTNVAGTLAWKTPILYYFPASKTGHLELDFTTPTAPYWTGPHTSLSNPVMGVARRPATWVNAAPALEVIVQNTMGAAQLTGAATNRAMLVRTGFLWQAGHDLIVRRVLLTTVRKTSGAALTVTLVREDGTSLALPTVTPKTTTAPQSATKVTTTSFAPVGGAVRAPAVYLELTAANTVDLELVRIEVEAEISERGQ